MSLPALTNSQSTYKCESDFRVPSCGHKKHLRLLVIWYTKTLTKTECSSQQHKTINTPWKKGLTQAHQHTPHTATLPPCHLQGTLHHKTQREPCKQPTLAGCTQHDSSLCFSKKHAHRIRVTVTVVKRQVTAKHLGSTKQVPATNRQQCRQPGAHTC